MTVAGAALSLLLREKPLQNAWRYPKIETLQSEALHESQGKRKYCALSHQGDKTCSALF